jgi:hypothetical protein
VGRWRGRTGGLAILALLAAATTLAAVGFAAVGTQSSPTGAEGAGWQLVVRGANDEELRRVALPDARFTLRYRNSIYGSLAEERFQVSPDGRIVLVELAADEAAVLDEYYEADRPQPTDADDARRWRATPLSPPTLEELVVAASEHGRRTVVVGGAEIPLWQLAPDGASAVTLEAERPG